MKTIASWLDGTHTFTPATNQKQLPAYVKYIMQTETVCLYRQAYKVL